MKFNFEFAEKISRTYSDECRPLCHELKLPQTAFDIPVSYTHLTLPTKLEV